MPFLGIYTLLPFQLQLSVPAPPSQMQLQRSPKKTPHTPAVPGTPSRPVRSEVDSTVPISEASNAANIQGNFLKMVSHVEICHQIKS